MAQVWRECEAFPDPRLQELFDKLEEAENYVGGLETRAAFFTGMYLAWGLSQSMER